MLIKARATFVLSMSQREEIDVMLIHERRWIGLGVALLELFILQTVLIPT